MSLLEVSGALQRQASGPTATQTKSPEIPINMIKNCLKRTFLDIFFLPQMKKNEKQRTIWEKRNETIKSFDSDFFFEDTKKVSSPEQIKGISLVLRYDLANFFLSSSFTCFFINQKLFMSVPWKQNRKNKILVLENTIIPVLGVKPKRGWYVL